MVTKPAWPFHPVVVLALCMLTLAACRNDLARPVADSTMVAVLTDLHLLNAREQVFDKPVANLRDSVLVRHGVDSAAFAQAIEFYASRPLEYADIYGRVVDKLTTERAPMSFTDSIQATAGSNALSP